MTKELAYRLREGIVLPRETKPVIRGYKYPLSPVEHGYGYYGTLAYDKSGYYTQCHICGYYFKGLSWHVSQSHKLPKQQYLAEYGLSSTTSLIAPEQKKVWKDPNLNMSLSADAQAKRLEALKKGRTVASYTGGKRGKSLERKNREGRCALQLLDKIVKLTEYLGRQPTKREFGKYYNQGYLGSVFNTFGTWNEAKQAALEMAVAKEVK